MVMPSDYHDRVAELAAALFFNPSEENKFASRALKQSLQISADALVKTESAAPGFVKLMMEQDPSGKKDIATFYSNIVSSALLAHIRNRRHSIEPALAALPEETNTILAQIGSGNAELRNEVLVLNLAEKMGQELQQKIERHHTRMS